MRRAALGLAVAASAALPGSARADFLDDVRRTFQKDIPRTFEHDIPKFFGAKPKEAEATPAKPVDGLKRVPPAPRR